MSISRKINCVGDLLKPDRANDQDAIIIILIELCFTHKNL